MKTPQQELIAAARYAEQILGKVKAFGDTIGTETNKLELGMAKRALTHALNRLEDEAIESLIGCNH